MDWKFKAGAPTQGGSDGFWYDLTAGGYIKPEEVLADPAQVIKLNKAIDLVSSFEDALENAGLLEEM